MPPDSTLREEFPHKDLNPGFDLKIIQMLSQLSYRGVVSIQFKVLYQDRESQTGFEPVASRSVGGRSTTELQGLTKRVFKVSPDPVL